MITVKNILFICGSLNQTTMMHKISSHFHDCNCWFSPYYGDGIINKLAQTNYLNFSILGGQFRSRTLDYLFNNNLKVDYRGIAHDYDLVFTCSDLIMPKNIRNKRVILVQEGMTDPENIFYYLVKALRLPRWLASTSMTGLSGYFDKFCVASEGYKEFFRKKGVPEHKLIVTGIPNFDDCRKFLNSNSVPYKNFVLAATSDMRETFKFENRHKFIKKVAAIANGRQIVFKLHPNEKVQRATSEIKRVIPEAIVVHEGDTESMIAHCDVLVTRYSSVVYVGIVLGKEVHSDFDIETLKKLAPLQNEGRSALNIALVGRDMLHEIHESHYMRMHNKHKKPSRVIK